ncbi:hypothetical protein B0J14DRAFT_590265 [Halenospora varia]|nr:hypothetical protein B0J14DRAFT_590265 [Halenospora varia]
MSSSNHAEIWDDSALVNSWNDALEEYKRYHSIQARGERVEDVLKAQEKQFKNEEMDYEDGELDEQSHLEPEAKQNMSGETVDHDTKPLGTDTPVQLKPSAPVQTSRSGTQNGGPALPQHLIGQVHDEGLKNLLMSWYYAGYYTGLYEGQQQGTAGTDAKHDN